MYTNMGYLLIAQFLVWPCVLGQESIAAEKFKREFNDYVEVKTESGWIRGLISKVEGVEIVSYLGVPYAKPPIGDQRFAGPQIPADPWPDVRNATEVGSDCYSIRDITFPGFEGSEMWNTALNFSEDCLNLNVWAPKDASNLTVMVWIFGGGFFSGSPSLDLYDGRILAATGNVIVVNINYRLGPFGFLYMGDETANLGLRDQQAALRWLNKNLHIFGGNPHRVTLFGESAGAASVSAHLFAPDSQEYFQYAIMQSGSITCPWAQRTMAESRKASKAFLQKIGCGNETHSDEWSIRCARSIDASIIHKSYLEFAATATFMEFHFVPVQEEKVFFKGNVLKHLKEGKYKKTSIIVGTVTDEGSFWLPYFLDTLFSNESQSLINLRQYNQSVFVAFNDYYYFPPVIRKSIAYHYMNSIISKDTTHPVQIPEHTYRSAISKIVGDYIFVCQTLDFGDQILENGGSVVYMFQFNERSSVNSWPKWMGVMHGYEIEYFFGVPLRSAGYTEAEVKFSRKMMQYWVNFAKHGKPQLDNHISENDQGNHTRRHHRHAHEPHWPVYDEKKSFLILQSASTKSAHNLIGHRDPMTDDCTFWKDINQQCQMNNSIHAGYKPQPLGNNSTNSCRNRFDSITFHILLTITMITIAQFHPFAYGNVIWDSLCA